MSLSPWDLGGISFDFNVYRPRRPSYLYATQHRRGRPASYRSATRADDSISTSSDLGSDFIEGMIQKRPRKNSYRRATRNSNSDNDIELESIECNRQSVVPQTKVPTPPVSPKNGSSVFDIPTVGPKSNAVNISQNPPGGTVPSGNGNPPIANPPRSGSTGSGLGMTDIRIEVTPPVNHLTPAQTPEIVTPAVTPDLDHSVYEVFQKVIEEHMNARMAREHQTDITGERHEPHSDSEDLDEVEINRTNWVYKKNLVIICIAFIFIFSAFRAIQNLQSSLNSKGSLGTIAMACVHGGMVLTCLFTPIVINVLTAKWSIALGVALHLLWIITNFFPHFATLIPTSLLLGFGQSLAWSGQVTFVSKLAIDYAHSLKEITDHEVYRFNGIFLGCFQTTHIWGNLISSVVLDSYAVDSVTIVDNKTVPVQPDLLLYCGIFDTCDNKGPAIWNASQSAITVAKTPVVTLMLTYGSFTLVGLLLVIMFLNRINAKMEHQRSVSEVAKQNFTQMFGHKTFRLLIPLLIFNGFEQGFVYADFTKSFITCKLGVHYVGYCMITLGIANCTSSVVVGLIAKRIHREVIIGVGGIVHIGLMVLLIMWMPDVSQVPVFFMVSILWGICDAVWQTQCNTLIAISCPHDHGIAFANFRLLQGFGAALCFALGGVTCVSIKLYIIMSLLTFAIMCYVMAEYNMRQNEPISELPGSSVPEQRNSTALPRPSVSPRRETPVS